VRGLLDLEIIVTPELSQDGCTCSKENYCVCRWRAYQLFNPNAEKLDLKKRSFTINSYGVLVKFTINKDEKGEKVMREFAELSQNYDKTDRDKYKLRRLEILSEVVDCKYVNKMGNL
jgi:hypothetical protein